MISEVNAQNLMRCIRNNENAANFDLAQWITPSSEPCGTYGCLLGNDMLAEGRYKEGYSSGSYWAGLGILRIPSQFLDAEKHYPCCPASGNEPFTLAQKEYGLNFRTATWLFSAMDMGPHKWGTFWNQDQRRYDHSHYSSCCHNMNRRDVYDKEAAIRRLRKFVYYVLRKRELLYDDSGRVLESARRTEGNIMLAQKVLEDIKTPELSCV